MASTTELLGMAAAYQESGNWQQAEALCRQILQTEPEHAAAHHLLGVTVFQAGKHADAIALIRRAIVLNPANDDCHFNLGAIFTKLGRRAEAIDCYRQALAMNPDHAMAYNNLGNVLMEQGQRAQAIDCYRQAVRINPRSAIMAYNLGNALRDEGQTAEAARCYRQAIANNPQHADAHNNLGAIHKNDGRLAEAALCYRQALRISPRHADALNNLGLVLVEQRQVSEGIACYHQALAINPQLADAHFNLGIALGSLGQTAQAIDCYRHALRIHSQLTGAYVNLGIALGAPEQLAEAVECYQQALRLEPDHVDARHNLSLALMVLGRIPEATKHNQEGLRLRPGYGPGLWQRALLRLLHGEFAGGWQDYEQRWSVPGRFAPAFKEPRWDGAPLAGKTILVYSEQGLGDTVQFVRYLSMVKERGGSVLFQCQPELLDLCTGMGGVDQIFAIGAPLPPFDVQVPLLSLPGIFGTTLANIPASVSYLRPDARLVEHWRMELARFAGFKVGIVWSGSPENTANRIRSLPLACFEPLTRLEGVRVFSLQVGAAAEEMRTASFPVIDLGRKFDPKSLSDLAAVIANLDLIITVETAVAHLAGALAAPVWTLLTLVPDWRWLLDRRDSPWYPTMRLFRQSHFRDWDSVMKDVTDRLTERCLHDNAKRINGPGHGLPSERQPPAGGSALPANSPG